MSTKTWLNPNYDKVLMEDVSLVNMEIDKLKEENEQLRNKVSELTEALDASSIFCEGVKEHYIKKACEWAEEWFSNGEEWMRRTSFIDGIKEELTKAMKGGNND